MMNSLQSYQRVFPRRQALREIKASYANLSHFLRPPSRAFIIWKWSNRRCFSSTRICSAENTDEQKIHPQHDLKEYVTEALKGAELDQHTNTVIAVLTASNWKRKNLEDPENRKKLLNALTQPWLHFDELGKKPAKLRKLSRVKMRHLSYAASTVATILVDFSKGQK